MTTPTFDLSVRAAVLNALTGGRYMLTRADLVEISMQRLEEISGICNETLIYDRLFRPRRQGRPYSNEEARGFLEWAREGWQTNQHFVFLVLTEDGQIAGALDIKSADLNAGEIGYWLSTHHSGVMTAALNVMTALARQAGFRRLWARPDRDNQRSIALLNRAGFVPDVSPRAPQEGEVHLELTL